LFSLINSSSSAALNRVSEQSAQFHIYILGKAFEEATCVKAIPDLKSNWQGNIFNNRLISPGHSCPEAKYASVFTMSE